MRRVIFISHSAKQARVAEAIVAGIESRGGKCWIAPRNIAQGVTYAGQIIEAIKQCNVMLVLVSADSIASPQVAREVERAVHYARKLMVVLLEEVDLCGDLEYFLSAVQWFPATKGVSEEVIERICSLLQEEQDPKAKATEAEPPDAAPRLPPSSKMGPGQVVVELGSSGKFANVCDAHHASDKALARIFFKGAAVVSWRLQPATVWFVMQSSSFTALQREFLSRTLQSATGVRWTTCRIVETAPNEKPYQVPLYLLSSYDEKAESTEGSSLVCFLRKIQGFEDEYAEAAVLLNKTTRSLAETEVYVTQRGEHTYVHGNFQQEGRDYPTKLCTTLKVSLGTLVSNLVRPPVTQEDVDEFVHHLQNTIKIYVNQDKFTITDPEFYSGARNVEFVADHAGLLRLYSDKASTRKELQAVFERQKDTLGVVHPDTLLTAQRIEGMLSGRTPGSTELPPSAAAKVTSAMKFAKKAGVPPCLYTLELAYRAGMHDKAREGLEEALRNNGALGLQLVEEVEKYDSELARSVVTDDIQKLLADKTDAVSLRTKAQLWKRSGETAKANVEYRQLIALDEATDDDFTDAAWNAPRQEGPEEFVAICEKGLEKHPESSLLNHNYGRLLRISGRFQDALRKLQRVVEILDTRGLRPGSVTLYDLVCCEWLTGSAGASHIAELVASDLSKATEAYELVRDKLDREALSQVRTELLKELVENESVNSLRLQAMLQKDGGDSSRQLDLLKKVISEASPAKPVDFIDAALAARAVGDKAYMFEVLTQGEATCPADTHIPFRRGWVMYDEGNFEDARKSFLRTVEKLKQINDTPSASTLSGLARSQWRCHDDEGAASTMRLLCDKSPSTAIEVADELQNAGEAAMAGEARRIIARFDFPADSQEGLAAKAKALSKLDWLPECVAVSKQLAALPDATAQNHAELVYDARRLDDEALALTAYQTAMAKFPDDDVIPMNAGWSYVFAGKGREALAEFELGLSLCPPSRVYVYLPLGLAAAHWLLGNKEKSLEAFEQALKIDRSYEDEAKLRTIDLPDTELKVAEAVRQAYLASRAHG